MPEFKGTETTQIFQEETLNLVLAEKNIDVFMNYDTSKIAQTIADLTQKPVEVTITRTVQVTPDKKETVQ